MPVPPQGSEFGDLISQKIASEGETFYHHYDGLGSTAVLTDALGVTTDEYEYEAFGKTAAESGPTPNPYKWKAERGYSIEEETGFYQIHNAEYSPVSGRRIATRNFDGYESNLYLFNNNQPTQRLSTLSTFSGFQTLFSLISYRISNVDTPSTRPRIQPVPDPTVPNYSVLPELPLIAPKPEEASPPCLCCGVDGGDKMIEEGCERFQKTFNKPWGKFFDKLVESNKWLKGSIPLIPPLVKLYYSLKWLFDVDVTREECPYCCYKGGGDGVVSGKWMQERARARLGAELKITIGWEGHLFGVDDDEPPLKAWFGIRGTAFPRLSLEGSHNYISCWDSSSQLKLCGSLGSQFRLIGGFGVEIQAGPFSFKFGTQAYLEGNLTMWKGCIIVSDSGISIESGELGLEWEDWVLWAEICMGICYRFVWQ